MNIVVDDLMLHYQLVGKGRLVLLLHGWGDSSKGLVGLQKVLAEKYQVLSVDLPGFGASQPPKSAWDLDDYARLVDNLLTKLNLKQPYAAIGHSNGGALAIRAISLQLLQPQKLVLVAASGVRNSRSFKRIILQIIAKIGNIATIWMPDRYRRALRKSLYGAAGSDLLVVPQMEETFKKTVRQDVQADAATIDIPTLLIYAEKDPDVPLADGQTYKKLMGNARLEVVEGAGHFVHLEQPERVGQVIKEFLK